MPKAIFIRMIASMMLVSLIPISIACAAGSAFNAGFDQGITTATGLNGNAMTAMQNFDPKTVINHYTDNPKETAYQNNPDAIQNDAITNRESDPTAKAVNNSIHEHPQFDIKPDSPEVQQIVQNGNDAYGGITTQFGDCTKQTNCTTTYQTQACEETPKSSYQYCTKTLSVDLVPKQTVTHYTLIAHLATSEHYYAGAVIDVITGRVLNSGPHDASVALSGRLPANIDCHGLQGSIVSVQSSNPTTVIDYIDYPSCAGLNLNYHVTNQSKHGTVNMTIKIDIASTTMTEEPQDHWDDGCVGFSSTSNCLLQGERCSDPGSTHLIDGVSVFRNCWAYQDTYLCGGAGGDEGCEDYRRQGCEQIDSQCESKDDGGCHQYKQTFRCPQKTCTEVGMVCDGQTYCLTGDCVNQQKQADPDFQKSVSALSALDEASKNISTGESIFGGERKTCSKDIVNFANCCADDGWGMDIHLAQCSQEEKDLGAAKGNLVTTYIGDYCDTDALGVCITHRKAYCVFPSKLARIVQEQGRRGQLGISFGTPEKTNCRGLTIDEFSKIDFSQIDFSDFYADISKKEQIEDQGELDQRINDKMQTWAEGNTPHG